MKNHLKLKTALLIVIVFLFVWLVYNHFQPVAATPSKDQCIAAFDTFAFTFPDVNGPKQEVIKPLFPWKVVTALPEIENLPAGWVSSKLEVVGIRSIGDNLEIWVSNPRSRKNFVYLIYSVNTQEWSQIPLTNTNNSPSIESLHISKGQSIWRISIFDGNIVYFVFDESSKRFVEYYAEAIPSDWKLNNKSRSNNVFENIQTIWDESDIFWIFSGNDAIYSFDPAKLLFNRHASLDGYEYINEPTYNLKDTIFLGVFHDDGEQSTLQFNISDDHLEEIALPNWPVSTVSLVDSAGNLWLRDGYGLRISEGKWRRFNPNPINYWWHQEILADWKYYSPPDPVMQTSDGRIWFTTYRSEEWKTLRSGTAWFNPNTKEGCWFTSEGAQVSEDLQGNFWMVVGKELYKYENNP